MNRAQEKIQERREHVRETVENTGGQSTTTTIKELAKDLFLSESTIWKDLAKSYKSDIDKIE